MPFPIVPLVVGGGLVALLAAGKAEKKPGGTSAGSISPGASATPTQQSTGGTNGGAQAPSHADLEQASTPIADPVPGTKLVNAFVDAYNATPTKTPTATAAHPSTSPSDPWAPSPGPSITSANPDLQKVAGSTAGMTTRAVSDTFSKLGSAFGGIW